MYTTICYKAVHIQHTYKGNTHIIKVHMLHTYKGDTHMYTIIHNMIVHTYIYLYNIYIRAI